MTFLRKPCFLPRFAEYGPILFQPNGDTINSPSDFGPSYPELFPAAGSWLGHIPDYRRNGINESVVGFGPTSTLPNYPNQNILTWSDDLFYEKGKHS